MSPNDAIAKLAAAGWTESEIANAVGVAQSTINRIKRGARPNFEVGSALVALAKKRRKRAEGRRAA